MEKKKTHKETTRKLSLNVDGSFSFLDARDVVHSTGVFTAAPSLMKEGSGGSVKRQSSECGQATKIYVLVKIQKAGSDTVDEHRITLKAKGDKSVLEIFDAIMATLSKPERGLIMQGKYPTVDYTVPDCFGVNYRWVSMCFDTSKKVMEGDQERDEINMDPFDFDLDAFRQDTRASVASASPSAERNTFLYAIAAIGFLTAILWFIYSNSKSDAIYIETPLLTDEL